MLFSKLEEYYIIFLMSDFIGCPQDRRRVEIEQKLEREAQQEKDEAARARKSLFQQRRSQQDEVTRLQKKLMIAEMVNNLLLCGQHAML